MVQVQVKSSSPSTTINIPHLNNQSECLKLHNEKKKQTEHLYDVKDFPSVYNDWKYL